MKIAIKTGKDGADIFGGDHLVDPKSGEGFMLICKSGHYDDGAEVEIRSLTETGFAPSPGTELMWVNPRPGVAHTARVVAPITRADFDRLEARLAAAEKVIAEYEARAQRVANALRELPQAMRGLSSGTVRVSVERFTQATGNGEAAS